MRFSYPNLANLNEYQRRYILLVPTHLNLLEALTYSHQQLMECLLNISEEQSTFAYSSEKWSIKKLVLHISDTDRIFQYRALAIARGTKDNLPPFNENEFADNSYADNLTFQSIINEYELVAQSFQILYSNMNVDCCNWEGVANNTKISAGMIGFLAAGHRLHHLQILKERYLI